MIEYVQMLSFNYEKQSVNAIWRHCVCISRVRFSEPSHTVQIYPYISAHHSEGYPL